MSRTMNTSKLYTDGASKAGTKRTDKDLLDASVQDNPVPAAPNFVNLDAAFSISSAAPLIKLMHFKVFAIARPLSRPYPAKEQNRARAGHRRSISNPAQH